MVDTNETGEVSYAEFAAAYDGEDYWSDDGNYVAIDPDDLAATFGEGVGLKRIAVQMTDDPVTTGIEQRLGWVPSTRGAIAPVTPDERPPLGTPLPLHANLTEMDFERGAN